MAREQLPPVFDTKEDRKPGLPGAQRSEGEPSKPSLIGPSPAKRRRGSIRERIAKRNEKSRFPSRGASRETLRDLRDL